VTNTLGCTYCSLNNDEFFILLTLSTKKFSCWNVWHVFNNFFDKCISISFKYYLFISIPGKGGQKIKTISSETNTKIHFPDANKTAADKHNNVTIRPNSTGNIHNCEEARRILRDATPIVLSFFIDRSVYESKNRDGSLNPTLYVLAGCSQAQVIERIQIIHNTICIVIMTIEFKWLNTNKWFQNYLNPSPRALFSSHVLFILIIVHHFVEFEMQH